MISLFAELNSLLTCTDIAIDEVLEWFLTPSAGKLYSYRANPIRRATLHATSDSEGAVAVACNVACNGCKD